MVALTHSPSLAWKDYVPEWCTVKGRAFLSKHLSNLDECKKLCIMMNPKCNAVEWWQQFGGICYECTKPYLKCPYYNLGSLAYPPHVLIKENKSGRSTLFCLYKRQRKF